MTLTARPTTYRGIDMRSRTEARFAAFLDRVGIEWAYEPRAYADASGQYLPDFRLLASSWPSTVFVDVKGTLTTVEYHHLRARMRIIWTSDPRALLVIAPADWSRQRLLVDNPSVPERGAQEGFFGSCPQGHAGIGLVQGASGIPHLYGVCGYFGEPATFLRPFGEPGVRRG